MSLPKSEDLEALDAYIEFACRDASCRPPPSGGTGGSLPGKGGKKTVATIDDSPPVGGKAFSRISAHPDNRAKPIPSIAADGSKEDEAEAKEAGYESVEAWVKAAYSGDLGNGYHSEVTMFEHDTEVAKGFYVEGVIYDSLKRPVGSFKRYIMKEDRFLAATHELLDISYNHQGKGLGDRFNARSVAVYRELGVDRIYLKAEMDVGAYAWARQGFRIDGDESDRRETIERLISYVKNYPDANRSPQDLKELAALRKASNAGQDVQPIHIASIGESRAGKTPTWLGKEILLGNNWPGVYYFDRKNPVTASAVELAYAALRPKWTVTT